MFSKRALCIPFHLLKSVRTAGCTMHSSCRSLSGAEKAMEANLALSKDPSACLIPQPKASSVDGIKESVVFPVKVLGGGIRVIDWNPAFRKNGADSGLAASDASGDSHSPHCRPSSTQSNTSGVTVHSMTPSGILEA